MCAARRRGWAQPFQFTGQQTDADSSLQYLRARYYDPTTGRFLSKDPVPGQFALPQTQNRYSYAYDNPILFTDPSGLCGILSCVGNVVDTGISIGKQAAPWVGICGAGLIYAPATLACTAKVTSTFLPLDDLGYVDLNYTGCRGVCITGGVQLSFGEGIHFYGGGGGGYGAGSINITYAPGQHITNGKGCGVSASYANGIGPSGQFGVSGVDSKEGGTFGEIGVAVGYGPSVAYTCYYVLPNIFG